MPKMYSQSEIKERVMAALDRLFRQDSYLIDNDVNERSITFKLGCYLQDEFPDWNVDCEYNRDIDSDDLKKRLPHTTEQVDMDDIEGKTIFPDIIIHARGQRENLLVIEVKKSPVREPKSEQMDCIKLSKLTESKYLNGLWIILDCEEKTRTFDWFPKSRIDR